MSRITARLTSTALASVALLAAAALPAAAADHHRDHERSAHQHSRELPSRQLPTRASVVLGQIHQESRFGARGNRSLNDEWVTVTNESRRTADLNGWTLSDSDGNRYSFHLRLAGHQSVRVHSGTGWDTTRDVYQNRRNHVWDSSSDTATLRDNRGHLVDTESYGRRHLGGHH
ncbi:lamin tail domain-containing protein [Streptomyces sp. NBC_01190]|uniref:lamin tail domain-containing protein n=1 Tax=Streptomyces sp. NBC_01190 TaxID=2903767 RepID=UPI003869C3CD|nr:lamin tail domain-containing protein [Streptomyces sp. NBC_01190]